MRILVVTLKRKSNADKISEYTNSIRCCAICSESQEIPLGEAAVSGTVLGQVRTGLQGCLSKYGISRKGCL